MPDKKTRNLEFSHTPPQLISQSVFDVFVKEIKISEVPTKYIQKIIVFYLNGNIIELNKNEIEHPLPVNRNGNWESMRGPYKNIKEIKVYVDIPKLEEDINMTVDYLFGQDTPL